MKKLSIIYVLFSLLALLSCQKELDRTPPTVIIDSPTEFAVIGVKDGVLVSGNASDDKNLESVSIHLINYSSRFSAGQVKVFYPNDKNFSFRYFFDIKDTLLESGDYYFKVEANDGENVIAAFRDIKIQGITRSKLNAVVAVGDENSTDFISIDESFITSTFWSISKGCKEFVLNSYDQQIWFAPSNSNELTCFQLNDNQIILKKNVNVLGLTNPFLDIAYQDRKVYLSTRSGELREYRYNLSDRLLYSGSENRLVEKIIPTSEEIIINESIGNSSSSFKLLKALFLNSGALKSSANLNFKPLGVNKTITSEKRLIVSDSSNFYTYFYRPDDGNLNRVYVKSNYSFDDAIAISDYEFILISESQIATFNSQTNFFRIVKSGANNAVAAFDDINREIWVGSGTEINVYNYSNLTLRRTISLNAEIKGIQIRYNR